MKYAMKSACGCALWPKWMLTSAASPGACLTSTRSGRVLLVRTIELIRKTRQETAAITKKTFPSSTQKYGATCCGPNSECVDPVPGTCFQGTISEVHAKCLSLGLEMCRDSSLCSNCKSTKCYSDGVKILGFKSYLSR